MSDTFVTKTIPQLGELAGLEPTDQVVVSRGEGPAMKATMQEMLAYMSERGLGPPIARATVAELLLVEPEIYGVVGEVYDDPAGDVPDGNGRWLWTTEWTWLDSLLPEAVETALNELQTDVAGLIQSTEPDEDNAEVFLYDAAGNRVPLGPGGVTFDKARRRITTPDLSIGIADDQEEALYVIDAAGNRHRYGASFPAGDDTVSATLWTQAEYAFVQARAEAEALRLNTQDVSGYQKLISGCNLIIGTGQSFMAGSDNARLFLSSSRIALLAATTFPGLENRPTYSVGPDTRCVEPGPVFVPYNGGDLTFERAQENFTLGTGSDTIVSDADVATGNYPNNARGGTPEIIRDILAWVFRNRWHGRADTAVTGEDVIAMNHAKTDGSVIEVTTGDGLSRMQSLIEVFNAAVTFNRGAGGARRCGLVDGSHGEADAGVSPASAFKIGWEVFRTNILAKLNSELGQTSPPMFFHQTPGGARYGSTNFYSSIAMVDMMRDTTGTSAGFHLVGCKYEGPHLFFVQPGTGHPNALDGHPIMAGNALMGIRSASAFHYIHDREENYWVPFPYEVYFSGKRFLIAMPCKFPPLRAVPMMNGTATAMLASLGINFESEAGAENAVAYARMVPSFGMLVEGECATDIDGYRVSKTAKNNGVTLFGFTNIRDSYAVDLPLSLPFDRNQTIYSTGYRDDPLTNGLSRYLEDIAEVVGKPDLGNPCAPYSITAQPMPEL